MQSLCKVSAEPSLLELCQAAGLKVHLHWKRAESLCKASAEPSLLELCQAAGLKVHLHWKRAEGPIKPDEGGFVQSPGQVSEACFANGTLGNVIPSHLSRAVSAKALTEGNALVLRTLKSAGDHEGVALYSVFCAYSALAKNMRIPSVPPRFTRLCAQPPLSVEEWPAAILGAALTLHKLCITLGAEEAG